MVDYPPIFGTPSVAGKGGSAEMMGHLRLADGLVVVLGAFQEGAASQEPWDLFRSECLLLDMDPIARRLERIAQQTRRPLPEKEKKVLAEEQFLLEECRRTLEQERPISSMEALSRKESARMLSGFGFFTAKPWLLLRNARGPERPPDSFSYPMVVSNLSAEADLWDLPEGDREEFRKGLDLFPPLAERFAEGALAALGLIRFYTVGEDEVRAWLLKTGSLAPEAAGVIHTDLQKGFIRAEVFSFEAFERHGSPAAVKGAGELRTEGKTYVVRDGDILVVHFSS
jgi:ribosome-binding ATPase YchF (GTP1/OBG family)